MALASLTGILAASRSAEAVSISPGSALQITTTTYNSTINTPEEWLKYLGLSPAPVLLYKSNVDKTSAVGLGVDEGQYADNYKTTFSNPANDPANALIEYLGGSPISCGTCYLLVKGGNQVPSQYLFDLSKWNGTDSLVLSNFWPANGAISNVAIYSTVPEPAILSLLAVGMVGVGIARRRRRG